MTSIGSLEVERGPDFIEIRQRHENAPAANFALAAAAAAYGGLVAIVLPTLGVSRATYATWIGLGAAGLAIIGALMHLRGRVATLRLDGGGVSIEQGTPLDLEQATVAWGELSAVEVEAVDERKPKRGVQLRLSRKDGGEAVDALPGVGVTELTDVRRLVIEAWRSFRADAPR